MKNTYSTYFFGLILLVSAGCAQLGVPNGGLIDKSAPVIVKSIPENEAVNFMGSTIQLTFDEYIQLNDINNQLIISPPLKERPEISVKKRTVTIELKEKLIENTTYSINFGEGIKDYNAGNILRNSIMAFSTGEVLDSLSIKGNVFDALSTEPKENVKVMLYKSFEDSLPRTTKPYYFTQTDKSGNFRIKYLPEGKYKVFALEEIDGDFLYDELEENIGFIDSLVELSSADTLMTELAIPLFNEDIDLGYISSIKTDSIGQFKIAFSTAQKDVLVYQTESGDSSVVTHRFNLNRDTMFCFTKRGTPIFLERSDERYSNSEVLLDTVELKTFSATEGSSYKKKVVVKKQFKRNLRVNQELLFTTSRPILEIDTSLIKLVREDSIQLLDFGVEKKNKFQFLLNTNSTIGGDYSLELLPGAVTSMYQSAEMDTTKINFSFLEIRELGDIVIQFELETSTPLLVLSDKSKNVIKKIVPVENEASSFNGLLPGNYSLISIDDTNQDSTWTTGNYDLKMQPESITIFPSKLEVRANWSQEFVWKNQ